jgi:glycosyltransferase involved in cell wall biosynthesis
MKILHIINNLQPAGAEILLSDIAIAMKGKGVQSEVLTLFEYPEKSLYRKLSEAGVVVHSLNFSFRYDLRVLFAIRRIALEGNYDIIHANLFPAFYWTALSRPRCKKMILTEHNTFNHRTAVPILKPIESLMFKEYDGIVCISNDVLTGLSARFPSISDRMKVIYNGIDIQRFATASPIDRQTLRVPAEAKICAMVSRFYKPKDHKTVIDAAVLVPNLHVLFAGEGELEHPMRTHARAMGVENRIHFLGYRNDIASLLKASDICVQSSYNEGFSLSVAEAMACGIPVIASNVHALNEVVQNNISGLLFRCGDPKDLAEKINLVFKDFELCKRLKLGALARAQDFSLDETVDSLLKVYNS